jgi:hypothetical protein
MRLAPPIACQGIIDWTYRQSGAIDEWPTVQDAPQKRFRDGQTSNGDIANAP